MKTADVTFLGNSECEWVKNLLNKAILEHARYILFFKSTPSKFFSQDVCQNIALLWISGVTEKEGRNWVLRRF